MVALSPDKGADDIRSAFHEFAAGHGCHHVMK